MEREIKFRGISNRNEKEFVYGYFWKAPDGTNYIKQNGEDIQVNPETVGQSINLTDINGKEIFEDDVVKICTDKDNPNDYSRTKGFYGNIGRIAHLYCEFLYFGIEQGDAERDANILRISGEFCGSDIDGNDTVDCDLLEVIDNKHHTKKYKGCFE